MWLYANEYNQIKGRFVSTCIRTVKGIKFMGIPSPWVRISLS